MSKIKKKYKKSKNNFKKHHVLYLLFLVFCIFFVVVNISDIFSGLLTHGGSIFFKQKIEVPSYSVYAVSLDDFNNEFDANVFAREVENLGGSGYVLKKGEYFVFASSYPTLAEAQEIQANLIEIGYNSRVVNISIPEVSFFYQGKYLNFFKDCITLFKDIYCKMYDDIILFDQQKISKSKINGNISAFISNISELQDKFLQLKSNFDMKIVNILSPHLKVLSQKLKTILSSAPDNDMAFTSTLKTVVIEVAIQNELLSCDFKQNL